MQNGKRRKRHKKLYGAAKLPKRGTGIKKVIKQW